MKKNEWSLVKNMYEPHYGHAGTVHGDLMYISGDLTTLSLNASYSCVMSTFAFEMGMARQ